MRTQSVVPQAAAKAPPIHALVDQNQTEGGGGCDSGYEKDVNPSSGTYGTCIPLPSGNVTVYCGGMCGDAANAAFADFCDMVCQAWNGTYADGDYGFSPGGFGGTANSVIDCSQQDPNNPDPSCLYARIPPANGLNCWGSNGALGYNWPVGTSDAHHEITDIYALVANNVSGQPAVIGWEYLTGSGNYVEEKPGFGDFWTTVLSSNPVTSTLLNLLAAPGSTTPVSSEQGNAIGNYIINHNGQAGSCFTHRLTV